jgi:hypothetical protein
MRVATGIGGAVVLCLALFTWNWLTSEQSDRPALSAPLAELTDVLNQEREMHPPLKRALERHKAKSEVICDVIADRLRLMEAAARYRDLNADFPRTIHWLEQRYPGVPYELALCRQIIDTVHGELREAAPDPVDPLVSRLEAELAEHLRYDGQVHLP